jgi:hypothetical protein
MPELSGLDNCPQAGDPLEGAQILLQSIRRWGLGHRLAAAPEDLRELGDRQTKGIRYPDCGDRRGAVMQTLSVGLGFGHSDRL